MLVLERLDRDHLFLKGRIPISADIAEKLLCVCMHSFPLHLSA